MTKARPAQDPVVNDEDPFEIMQEIRAAPRPRAGRISNIVEFYAGRSVLITGASGFIGKVLIEKLLRTCPGIKRVFVLIRPKYNKQPHERLTELLDSRLFDGLRAEDQQQLADRVRLVEGDVTQANLGLSNRDLAQIVREVSVIFHSAATVKFDEPLKQSVAINIAGTRNMINVCRRIPRLAALVHVSTAYANCDLDAIDEHIYPVDMEPERLLEMADWLDQDTLQELKKRLLGAKPNTYTYTKSLAEWLLVRSARDLPVVICRPSIVVASASEPFKGWIDNMNGPTGVVLGAGKGLIRTMYAENEFVADLVPVDKVINLIVTLGWFANLNRLQRKQLVGSLDDGLSDSLLTGGSSVCSSGSGSSAASTSGVDDSLQGEEEEEEMQHVALNEHDGLHEQTSRQIERMQKARARHNRRRHHHHRHHHHHHHHHHHRRHLHERRLDEDVFSSHEDECADMSLASESSSEDRCQMRMGQRGTGSAGAASGGARQHDDGYSSRTPDYANSVASSASGSPACFLKDKSSSAARQPFAGAEKRPPLEAGVLSISELEETSSQLSGNSSLLEGSQTSLEGETTGANSEELAAKLRAFKARTLAKLNAKAMPEELAEIPVFHCTSGAENPITWGRVQLFILAACAIFPSSATYRYPCGSFTNSHKLDKFYSLTLHYLPAYLLDFLTRTLGGKPVLVKIFKKFDQAAGVLKAFTTKQWQFSYDNRLYLMRELMNEEDRRLFDCDMASLDWRQFCCDYVIGVRKFLLREPMSNLAEARRNLRRVYFRNLCLQLASALVGAYYAAHWIGLAGQG